MLEWLQQKKEQVISFVKSASAAQDVPDAEGQEEQNGQRRGLGKQDLAARTGGLGDENEK